MGTCFTNTQKTETRFQPVVTQYKGLSIVETMTSNKTIWTLSLFPCALLRGKWLPLKSSNSVNLCHHSQALSAIHLEQQNRTRPCNLQITFVLLSGGIFGVQLSVTERDVCLLQSNGVSRSTADSTNYIQPLSCSSLSRLGRWKTQQRGALRSRL